MSFDTIHLHNKALLLEAQKCKLQKIRNLSEIVKYAR